MALSDEQKTQILNRLYDHHRSEISFYRDRSWDVTKWAVGIELAFSAAVSVSERDLSLLLVPAIALALGATLYLRKNYDSYVDRWKMLERVEIGLGVYDRDVYLAEAPLYESEDRRPPSLLRGTGAFIALVWIALTATVVSLVWG